MPRFKSNIFHQYSPKVKLFLKKKCKVFKRWGHRPQTPVPPVAGGFAPRPPIASAAWGLRSQTSQNSPLNCEFLATCLPRFAPVYNPMAFRSFCFEQFFLRRSVANLM